MGRNSVSPSILTPETSKNTGSQNAVRHATLSALAYNKFIDAGVTATLNSHEENTFVDPNQTTFQTVPSSPQNITPNRSNILFGVCFSRSYERN